MQGEVKRIFQHRGFGFISVEDEEDDIFFHHTNLQNSELDQLKIGSVVEFEIEETEKGPNAINIKVVE